jgi:hypothetical protein
MTLTLKRQLHEREKGGPMKKGAGKKKDAKKKREFNRRLLNYSMAAGTTLALTTPANAAIRYSGVKNQIIDNNVFQLDMQDVLYGNPDGNPEFSFVNYDYNYTSTSTFTTTGGKAFAGTYSYRIRLNAVYPINSGDAFVADGTKYGAAFFQQGDRIGPDATYFVSYYPGVLDKYYKFGFHGVNTTNPAETFDTSYSIKNGNFTGKIGFIGVRFLISGKTHYGWIRFNNSLNRAPATIVDWAYEDVPGAAIAAGDTGQTPIPTLNQWGMMFLAGLILLEGARRLRKGNSRENEE